jgi:uncharacterized membrane protein
MAIDTTAVAPLPAAPRPARRSRFGWGTVAVLAFLIAFISLATYGSATLESLAVDEPSVAAPYVDAPALVRAALYLHIVAASIALLLGPLQFLRGLRNRAPRVHRGTGRVYLVAVVCAGLSALVIAPYNSAGLVGVFGFGLLAVFWLVTAWYAYRSARQREIPTHQAWMIRNYALTFAAVTLRLWLPVLMGIQVGLGGQEVDTVEIFFNAYAIVPFLCWVPNLLVAEWLIRRRGLPGLFARRSTPR